MPLAMASAGGESTDVGSLRTAAADLILGARCAGCSQVGRLLCDACADTLRPTAQVVWPGPTPPSLIEPIPVPPYASGEYDGPLRSAVLQFKEQRRLALLPTLSRLLLASIAATPTSDGPVALVPMPSRRSAVRERGYDAVALLAARAARCLRRRGRDAIAVRVLRHRSAVRDQAGLSAEQRAANLAGSLRVGHGLPGDRAVIVVDDVLTTGASMAEAVSALRRSGTQPSAIAVVAATRRRARSSSRW